MKISDKIKKEKEGIITTLKARIIANLPLEGSIRKFVRGKIDNFEFDLHLEEIRNHTIDVTKKEIKKLELVHFEDKSPLILTVRGKEYRKFIQLEEALKLLDGLKK